MKIPEIQLLDNLLFKPQGMNLSNIELDAESKDYLAQTFQLDNQNIIFRKAKITPTKTGQFVTVWKRNGKGITAPFSVSDELDFIIVFRAPLKTLLWLLTCSSFQLLRCRNTHLAQLNSVFSALYLKKITALSFQTELLEMPLLKKRNFLVHLFSQKQFCTKKRLSLMRTKMENVVSGFIRHGI